MSSPLESAGSLEEASRLGRALPLTAVPGPHGPDRPIGSIGVGFRLGGEHTGGRVAIVEHPFPPGALVPPHLHTREDEFSIVTSGTIGFRSGDDEVVLEAGGYIVKPRGELHTMWNAGTEEARMIEVITPAGFERFFAELADMFESGAPGPDDMQELTARYGVFFDPTWVPELMQRHGLRSPFG
ncbi:cupin domain-containing protein [Kineococcus glutinatus]|uniref:Cupin type-2 domain-containing protein n=1 Tax=Kineococcus glutinatus TaxID=1070872 RepID=A0ABP8VDH1_9ACTN